MVGENEACSKISAIVISTLTNVDDQLFFKVDSALFYVGFVVAIKKIAISNQPIPSISDLGK